MQAGPLAECLLLAVPSVRVCAALNVSVFLLIGKTSALTLNIAGFAKDWLLIAMSALVYG